MLRKRLQYVQVGDAKSSMQPVTSGVTQGGLTSTLFYNMAAKPGLEGLEQYGVKYYCYADNIRLVFDASDLVKAAKVQEALNLIGFRTKESGLKFNGLKSNLVQYGNGQIDFNFELNGQIVPKMNETKDLGCFFSNSMNFDLHVNEAVKKGKKVISIIKSCFKVRSQKLLKKLYEIYYAPIILYSSPLWYSRRPGIVKALNSAFKTFWKLSGGFFPVPDILDLNQMALKQTLLFMFKSKNKMLDLDYNEYFYHNVDPRTRAGNLNNMVAKKFKHEFRRNFFSNVIVEWYNRLDFRRETKKIGTFKRCVLEMLKREVPNKFAHTIVKHTVY